MVLKGWSQSVELEVESCLGSMRMVVVLDTLSLGIHVLNVSGILTLHDDMLWKLPCLHYWPDCLI